MNNAYLATLISFWNEINILTTRLGLDTEKIASIVKMDPRVSNYGTSFFGKPFGGKCLPKDLAKLIKAFKQSGIDPILLKAVWSVNEAIKRGWK